MLTWPLGHKGVKYFPRLFPSWQQREADTLHGDRSTMVAPAQHTRAPLCPWNVRQGLSRLGLVEQVAPVPPPDLLLALVFQPR